MGNQSVSGGNLSADTAVTPPGAGTVADPYQISELGHLVWMGENVGSSSGKYYTVQNDIDASVTTNWDGGAGFAPIGSNGTNFMGVFNGNGHALTGLTINRPGQNYVGLFGCVGSGGVVKDLGLAGGSVKGLTYVGSLVGYNTYGTLSGCYATCPVRGNFFIGGLVGFNQYGAVSGCHAEGAVTGNSMVGGLVGENAYGTVSGCYATGTVNGGNYAGGLVGGNEHNVGAVSNCYATGSVTGNNYVGGLMGLNYSPVSGCYATGLVTGNNNVGGLVGWNNGGAVSGCYWDTNTSGQATSSGGTGKNTAEMKQQATFVGWDFATVWRIAEDVTYPLLRPVPFYIAIGGATEVGENSGSQYVCTAYYSTGSSSNVSSSASWSETSPYASIDSFGYLTTAAVASDQPCQIAATYGGKSDTRDITIWNGPDAVAPPGAGTKASPYLISQLEHLVWMGDSVGSSSGKYYTVQNDMDASVTTNWNRGAGFAPIGFGSMFQGVFNGNGKAIRNLRINRPSHNHVGLFGSIGVGGVVKNLGLVDVSVTGDLSVGCLVGLNGGAVVGCYATGTVSGSHNLGGLVGNNGGAGATVSNCFATCSVTGDSSSYEDGGLVGWNFGTVSGCYSTGFVLGSEPSIGGLVGYNDGTVNRSYWDTQSSGQATSAGGTGRTTEQMKRQATFVGWDFVHIWSITEGVTCPLLRVEVARPARCDFDGDGKSDYGCYDAAGVPGVVDPGQWYFMQSTEGFDASVTFGFAGTVPVVGDFDGDGTVDYGCYYAPGGKWYFMTSKNGFITKQFGFAGTVPVVGDFDGDGTDDYGCYYAPGGNWYYMTSKKGFITKQFGFAGTVPVVGDFDGDGTDDYGCYYAPGGNWYYMTSKKGFITKQFGFVGTVPVVGDFDGDGTDDYGCYYAPGGNWYFMTSKNGFFTRQFGYDGTVPVVGDYDGDGTDDFGCYDAVGVPGVVTPGAWYFMQSTKGFSTKSFGYAGTVPVR